MTSFTQQIAVIRLNVPDYLQTEECCGLLLCCIMNEYLSLLRFLFFFFFQDTCCLVLSRRFSPLPSLFFFFFSPSATRHFRTWGCFYTQLNLNSPKTQPTGQWAGIGIARLPSTGVAAPCIACFTEGNGVLKV